jgi:hypothetical protein
MLSTGTLALALLMNNSCTFDAILARFTENVFHLFL